MIIKGLNIKGLLFKNYNFNGWMPLTIDNNICFHKYGKLATWSQNTDGYMPVIADNGYDGEIHAFKYNLPVTAFDRPFDDLIYNRVQEIIDCSDTGRISFEVYFMNYAWKNPITGIIENIPSWEQTIWGQNACDAGLIDQSLVGTAKISRYPSITNDMYNLTNGRYGYDSLNHVMGEFDVFTELVNFQIDHVADNFGQYPSCASQAYGVTRNIELMKDHFIGIRNSVYDANEFSYDIVDLSNIASTTNFENQVALGGERVAVMQTCADILSNVIINGGWYREFHHWHSDNDTMLGEYFRTQSEVLDINDVVKLDYGSAVEYMKFRQLSSEINFYTKDNKLFAMASTIKFKLCEKAINTTLSVQIDLTDTYLQNKELKSSHGIQKISANIFIVEIPYIGFATIEEDITGQYLNFNKPIINNCTLTNNILNVVTDINTKVAIFKVIEGLELYNAEIVKRDNVLSTNHNIDFTGIVTSGIDFYIGVITNEGQSILSSKYNF